MDNGKQPVDFNEDTLRGLLSGRRIGGSVYFFRKVASTNEIACELALKGASEGTVVIADAQTKGKGRFNRVWQSPAGCNLYTSIVIRPPTEPALASQITLMTGVAVAELLSSYCPYVTLKWPNDVQIGGKKVSGILAQMRASGKRVDFIIVGIGTNINMKRDAFEETIQDISTSLREETGGDISRVDLTVKLYDSFERWYARYIRDGFDPIRDMWLKYNSKGRHVQVVSGNELYKGEVVGIDGDGALLLRDENKITRRIIAGDVSILRGLVCF
ncbi:MAG: biotin--[acetyl-CoA-carboxylase] ligase [Syntrophaceae bacterium CG2_30_49_12]|nr:MAG: biotin--[acetyl-CoA-carboxylase] ligase [Syntrophaceae bacterium CG2_30_49_12]